MLKSPLCCLTLVLVLGCGGGEAGHEPSDPQEAVDRTLAGESSVKESSGDACSLISGPLAELVEVDLDAANVRGVELMGNDVCTIGWELAEGESAKRYGNEVSLTVMGTTYDSSAAAVASLESAVTTLGEGVSVEVQGQKHTVKSGFGHWIDGVGDRAITKKRAVLVAANGRLFTVGLRVSDDDVENQALAIELATRIAAGT